MGEFHSHLRCNVLDVYRFLDVYRATCGNINLFETEECRGHGRVGGNRGRVLLGPFPQPLSPVGLHRDGWPDVFTVQPARWHGALGGQM